MPTTPDERFASLLASSRERGWRPSDPPGPPLRGLPARADLRRDEAGGGADDPLAEDGCVAELWDDEPNGDGARWTVTRTAVISCLCAIAVIVGVFVVIGPREESAADAHGAGGEASPASPAVAAADGEVVVHIVGAVAEPGVRRLPTGVRAADAVDAAGGATEDADLTGLNLARIVEDGEQIVVPRIGESDAADESGTGAGAAGGADAGDAVDINAADLAALDELPGIGPVTAQAIIDHRESVGRFASVDELLDVDGIGEATLGRLRPHVRV